MTHDGTKKATTPFTIMVDTREQLPYSFTNIEAGGKRLIVPTESGTLHTGDYSIKEFDNCVAIERKSVNDFYGSITDERARLEAEFERMEAMVFSAIVVEGRLESVLDPFLHGRKVTPQAVRATIGAWSVRYRTRWFFLTSRNQGELMTFELLKQFYRHATERR